MDLKKPLSLAAALGFAASLTFAQAFAQEETGIGEQPDVQEELGQIEWQQLDQDGDGRVSKEEFMQHGSEQTFDQADQDGDGVLTEEEFRAAQEEQQQQQQPQ
jgi:hypothetical protein